LLPAMAKVALNRDACVFAAGVRLSEVQER
jgi:hypothetical protein